MNKENKMTLEQFRDDGDWRTIFMDVRDTSGGNLLGGVDSASNPTTREVRSFKMSDVAEVIAVANGEKDELSWIGLFRTVGGFYLFVEAWCDYTGWDCQSGASAEWHTDLDQAKAMISDGSRARLFPAEVE
jgi:hypothetical protein